jgi:hypothetical protein
MNPVAVSRRFPETPLIKWVYAIAVILLALTGFGQMPIFKRYYIAEVPGLGWLGDYYYTHALHYVGAALLVALAVYSAVVHLGLMRRYFRLTVAGYLKIILLAGIIVTGIFRVLKNLPEYYFSPDFIFVIDLAHLGFAMAFLLSLLVARIIGKGWLAPAPR